MEVGHKLKTMRLGRHYGYPECCINAFIADMEYIESTGEAPVRARGAQYPWDGTGFVPCNEHANQIMNGWLAIMNDILITRECTYPFPMDESMMRELQAQPAVEETG